MAIPARGIALDESRPIWQALLVFLIPLMLSSVLQSLGQTINSIYLGRFLGPHALAAAGNIFPIVFFMISFLMGLGSASSVLIGQAHGAGDVPRMQRIAGTTLGLGIFAGVAVGALCALFVRPLLYVIATPADIFDTSAEYARLVFLSFPLIFVYLLYSTFLRGTGDSRTPFYFLILSTALTMLITPAYIFGWLGLPKLGVLAAAWGNIIATAIALVALTVTLARTHSMLALSLRGVVRSSVALNYLIEGTLIGLAYLFANWILGLFLTSERTHEIARGLLNITLWSYAIFGNATVISGVVRSSGDVLVPMAISIFSIWGVEVPVAWVLSHRIGLAGVWYGYPAAFIVNVCLQFVYYELVWRRRPLKAIR